MWKQGWLLLALCACVDLSPPAPLLISPDASIGAAADAGRVDGAVDAGGVDAAVDAGGVDGQPDGGAPALKENGHGCASAAECSSGQCVDQVCCDSGCAGPCESCIEPGKAGSCSPVAAGTSCGAASCSNGVESLARTCNGSGTCSAEVLRACAPNICGPTACASGCTSPGGCTSEASCIGGSCVTAAGLQIYWSFDETSGLVATDMSGQNRNGSYGGTGASFPSPSNSLAPVQFPNTRSRAFNGNDHNEVRLRNIPASLRPANNITISAWFRVTGFQQSGYGDVISVADGWVLYMGQNRLLFSKRAAGGGYFNCDASTGVHADGNWHHLAGVSTSTGMVLYLDGMVRDTNPSGSAASYSQTQDFLVGADIDPAYGFYFGGNIDEVRYYTRALSAAEIAALAAGGR
jgi:hypothetical protein